MKLIIKTILTLIVIGALIACAIILYDRIRAQHRAPLFTPIPSSTDTGSGSGTTTDLVSIESTFPASTTIDIFSWGAYSNANLGFSIQYPSNLVNNADASSTWFVFPKDTYFHWPLQDDVKITVTVAPTCAPVISGAFSASSTPFVLNGYSFTRHQGSDVGAGNLYTEIAYDTQSQGKCYHISLFDHGTNGAGFYVDDQGLIKNYDNQHSVDMSGVISVFNGMVSSFKLNS